MAHINDMYRPPPHQEADVKKMKPSSPAQQGVNQFCQFKRPEVTAQLQIGADSDPPMEQVGR